MNYGNILFSPSGRIGPRAMLIGGAIVAALLFVVKASALLSVGLASILGIVGLVLIYCWFALFIKRSHDAGKSGWLAIIPVLLIVGVGIFVENFVQQSVAPDLMAEMELAMQEAIEGGFGEVMAVGTEFGAEVATATALPVAAARFIWSMIVVYGFNALLKSDPGPNRYGPATLPAA